MQDRRRLLARLWSQIPGFEFPIHRAAGTDTRESGVTSASPPPIRSLIASDSFRRVVGRGSTGTLDLQSDAVVAAVCRPGVTGTTFTVSRRYKTLHEVAGKNRAMSENPAVGPNL